MKFNGNGVRTGKEDEKRSATEIEIWTRVWILNILNNERIFCCFTFQVEKNESYLKEDSQP